MVKIIGREVLPPCNPTHPPLLSRKEAGREGGRERGLFDLEFALIPRARLLLSDQAPKSKKNGRKKKCCRSWLLQTGFKKESLFLNTAPFLMPLPSFLPRPGKVGGRDGKVLVGSGARTGVCIDPLIAHGLLPDLLAPREAVSMATGPTPPSGRL